jgi:hypothetical protein
MPSNFLPQKTGLNVIIIYFRLFPFTRPQKLTSVPNLRFDGAPFRDDAFRRKLDANGRLRDS